MSNLDNYNNYNDHPSYKGLVYDQLCKRNCPPVSLFRCTVSRSRVRVHFSTDNAGFLSNGYKNNLQEKTVTTQKWHFLANLPYTFFALNEQGKYFKERTVGSMAPDIA